MVRKKIVARKSPRKAADDIPQKSRESNNNISIPLNRASTSASGSKLNVTTTNKSKIKSKKTSVMIDDRLVKLSKKIYKEIRSLQLSTKLLIPASPFMRLVREIMFQYNRSQLRIQVDALKALQESCELYMTQFFEDCNLATFHGKRVTLNVNDMRLVRRIRGPDDIINH